MTKTQLRKLKKLDAFLKENKMSLQGENITVGFNTHKYYKADNIFDEYVYLNLDLGLLRGMDSYIHQLKGFPKIKERYHINKYGELKLLK